MLSEVWSVRCFLMWGWIGPSVLETWLCFYSANSKLITGWHFFRGSVGLTEVLRAKSDRGGDGGRGHRGEGDPSPAGHNRVSRHTGTKPAGLVVNTGTDRIIWKAIITGEQHGVTEEQSHTEHTDSENTHVGFGSFLWRQASTEAEAIPKS